MKKFSIILILIAMISCKEKQQKERLIKSTFKNSEFIEIKDFQVCLPISYYEEPEKQYPVLYQMDCQNLFVDSSAYGGISWRYDSVADSLVLANQINEFIIVGINHAGIKRFSEYMPQKVVKAIPDEHKDSLIKRVEFPVYSDNFLKFLVNELKAEIDNTYRTLPDKENTYVGGSSMGGLISMYALCEYPEIFNAAICMSTHWIVSLDNSTPEIAMEIQRYFANNLPKNKKIYFDHGTEGLDQFYELYQKIADSVLIESGYRINENFLSKKFVGHDHNEYYWNKRLDVPLKFMFGTN